MHPTVVIARVASDQSFHIPTSNRIVGMTLPAVSQSTAGPAQDAADSPLSYAVPLAQVIGGGPLLVGRRVY